MDLQKYATVWMHFSAAVFLYLLKCPFPPFLNQVSDTLNPNWPKIPCVLITAFDS